LEVKREKKRRNSTLRVQTGTGVDLVVGRRKKKNGNLERPTRISERGQANLGKNHGKKRQVRIT